MTTTTAALVAEARPRIAPMTVGQVAEALERGEAILLDLRESSERSQMGAIPGAVSAPWGMLLFWDALTEAYHRTKPDPTGRVVLYCSAGGRAAEAADILQRMGYDNVTHLIGGFSAWRSAGRPVEDASA